MQMTPYLSFKGDCEAAFTFYAECFGGQLGPLFRYGGSPAEGEAPPGWENKVMHGSVTLSGQVLMGSDVAPERYEAPKGFMLSLHTASTADAERIFQDLGRGATIVMPLAETFWAARFGMLVDRYGIPWSVNCEVPASGSKA